MFLFYRKAKIQRLGMHLRLENLLSLILLLLVECGHL